MTISASPPDSRMKQATPRCNRRSSEAPAQVASTGSPPLLSGHDESLDRSLEQDFARWVGAQASLCISRRDMRQILDCSGASPRTRMTLSYRIAQIMPASSMACVSHVQKPARHFFPHLDLGNALEAELRWRSFPECRGAIHRWSRAFSAWMRDRAPLPGSCSACEALRRGTDGR